MRIPDSFKSAQRALQDKTIAWHKAVESTGTLGGKYTTPAEAVERTFQVNARVLSDALQAQEYGLRLGRDMQATASDNLPIPPGDYVEWDGRLYRVVGIVPRDSHVLLLGEAIG